MIQTNKQTPAFPPEYTEGSQEERDDCHVEGSRHQAPRHGQGGPPAPAQEGSYTLTVTQLQLYSYIVTVTGPCGPAQEGSYTLRVT